VTWWLGLPSLSSHALIGGLGGAALAAGAVVKWQEIVEKVIIPMILTPIAGLLAGYLVMTVILWSVRNSNPRRVSRGFRYAQTASAAAMAFGHGCRTLTFPGAGFVAALTRPLRPNQRSSGPPFVRTQRRGGHRQPPALSDRPRRAPLGIG